VLLTLLHPVPVSAPIAGLFCERTWRHALALLVGAILALLDASEGRRELVSA
jgi:hypothetical protein